MDAAGARAALAGATWVSVTVASPDADLEVLPPRRTAVVVDGPVFAARSSSAWVGGALPLGEDEWVVLDADPDASGLKLDQHARNLARQYASEANGDPATSAPGTLRATGFALARRDRAAPAARPACRRPRRWPPTTATRELLLDDLVRGIRVEVWDDVTKEWHSLHRRRVDGRRASPAACRSSTTLPTSGSSSSRRSTGRPGDTTTGTTCTRSSPAGTAGACPHRARG